MEIFCDVIDCNVMDDVIYCNIWRSAFISFVVFEVVWHSPLCYAVLDISIKEDIDKNVVNTKPSN